MKELLLNETSRPSQFIFKQLLKGLESSVRYRFSDPKKLVGAAGIQTGQTVLEIGCGSGFFTPALAEVVGEYGLVYSVDLHPVSVEATSRRMRSLGKQNVRVSQADAHHTDFPEALFDAVIVYGVVPAPFISEPRLSQELYRLLKPGGIVAVWTLVPFWSPQTLMQAAPFTLCAQQQRVHRLQKPLSE